VLYTTVVHNGINRYEQLLNFFIFKAGFLCVFVVVQHFVFISVSLGHLIFGVV